MVDSQLRIHYNLTVDMLLILRWLILNANFLFSKNFESVHRKREQKMWSKMACLIVFSLQMDYRFVKNATDQKIVKQEI